MFTITRESKDVKTIYTLHGYVVNPIYKNDRYIQISWHTGEPIINTRCAYMAGKVVCFETEDDAYNFIERFMTDPCRKNKHYINWKVIKYRERKNCDVEFTENVDPRYGKYLTVKHFNYKGRY